MKTLNKKNRFRNKRLLLPLMLIVALLISSATAYALYSVSIDEEVVQEREADTTTSSAPKDTTQDNDASNKEEHIENSKNPDNSHSTPTPSSDNITLSSENRDDTVVFTTKLRGISSGTCTLTVSDSAQTVTESVEIIYAPDFSTCAGFSIDKDRLTGNSWNVELRINAEGVTITKAIQHST